MSGADRANIDTGCGALLTGAGLDTVLFAPAAYATGTYLSPTIVTQGAAIFVFINITAFGTSTATLTLQALDPASGTWFTLLASAALAANAATTLTIAPGLATSANVSANGVVPRTIRAQLVITSGPCTMSAGASIVAL